MINTTHLLTDFEKKYSLEKKHRFYKPNYRESLYDCLTQNIYNTELVLCMNGIKPVSRFVADKFEHIKFLENWVKDKGIFLRSRKLKTLEEEVNLSNRINYIVYVGKELSNVEKALELDSKNSNHIGELLGYPKCCSLKWGGEAEKRELPNYGNSVNNYFKEYLSSKKLPLLNNPFFNFTANSLSFFYPCKLDCKEALVMHNKYAEVIQKDNPVFLKMLNSYLSLPILFLFPKEPNMLTFTLHFDEVFRIYFIGFEKSGIIYYKDFFIISYAFTDQVIDEEYKADCFVLLEKLIYGNKVYIKNDFIIIEGIDYYEKFQIKEFAKIIKFL